MLFTRRNSISLGNHILSTKLVHLHLNQFQDANYMFQMCEFAVTRWALAQNVKPAGLGSLFDYSQSQIPFPTLVVMQEEVVLLEHVCWDVKQSHSGKSFSLFWSDTSQT